jgi:acyl-CoA reductase-like NAD-dependent aldehyde dehydrogenase
VEKYKNLIGGKLVDPLSEGYFEDLNPANVRDIIGLFPNSNSRDVQSAAQSALYGVTSQPQKEWRLCIKQ